LQIILHDEARRGKTVLVTTHLLGEWNGVAHRCLLCREGIIEGELDPGKLADELGGPELLPRTVSGDMDRQCGDKTFKHYEHADISCDIR
jgi:ABC-type multidrug transport system ATPase subunit